MGLSEMHAISVYVLVNIPMFFCMSYKDNAFF